MVSLEVFLCILQHLAPIIALEELFLKTVQHTVSLRLVCRRFRDGCDRAEFWKDVPTRLVLDQCLHTCPALPTRNLLYSWLAPLYQQRERTKFFWHVLCTVVQRGGQNSKCLLQAREMVGMFELTLRDIPRHALRHKK